MRNAIILCFFILLTGCSSQPSTIQYYLLHASSDTRNADLSSATAIRLSKLAIPEYLRQRGMPLELADNQVHISKTHVWAEPFDKSALKLIKYAFEPDYLIAQSAVDNKISVAIDILHLIPNAQGNVTISANYAISNADNIVVRKAYSRSYALQKDGYSDSVSQYRQAIFDLSAKIKSEIQSVE